MAKLLLASFLLGGAVLIAGCIKARPSGP